VSKVTVRQAAKLTKKSPNTINEATKNGKLSFELNGQGHKVIDLSELERVFELVKPQAESSASQATVPGSPAVSSQDVRSQLTTLMEQLKHREEVQQILREERERERRQMQEEIERLNAALEKAQDQHSTALLLITDQSQSGGGETSKRLEEIHDQIAAQNVTFKKTLSAVKDDTRRDTIQEIKTLSWMELAFGKKLKA